MTVKRITEALQRRCDRYILIPLARRRFRDINILSSEDSVKYIIEHRCSVSRYGDGEFFIMMGKPMGFQQPNTGLAQRLNEVLQSDDAPNHMIGIPLPLKDLNIISMYDSKEFWGYYTLRYGEYIHSLLSSKRVYLDTQLSRFYKMYENKAFAERIVSLLRQIWYHRDVVIVEGTKSRSGVGNDLYDHAHSIRRILGPATNAFDKYDEMLQAITRNVSKDKLILLSYGMTATVLAYDLAKLGYWAIDLGHLDIEYEWYRMGAKEKVAVKGKYTNEASGGDVVEDCNDTEYLNQIICDITK